MQDGLGARTFSLQGGPAEALSSTKECEQIVETLELERAPVRVRDLGDTVKLAA